MNPKYQILTDIFNYSLSAIIAQGVSLFSGFWIANLLGPTDFGIWNALSLILAYGAYLELGVLGALGRDLPFYLGNGDIIKAASVEGAARRITIVTSVTGASAVIAYSILIPHSFQIQTGMMLLALGLILQQVYTYHRTVLRSNNSFKELSLQQTLFAIFSSILALLLVYFFDLNGRIVAAVLGQALILLYALKKNPWSRIPKLEWHVVWDLVRVGIPIAISGFILSLMVTIDRLMIITFLGEKELGFFGLAILLASVVTLIPTMAGQVLYPKIAFLYGKSERNVESLKSIVLTPPKILSSLLPIFIGFLYLLLPYVIDTFLPKYSAGIKSAQIVIIGIFFFGIIGLTDYLLVTIGKLKQYIFFGSVALVLTIVIDYTFLKLGYGIEGVAFGGKLITYYIYSFVIIGYALSHYSKLKSEWVRYFIRLWFPFIYMILLLWLVETLVGYFFPSDMSKKFLLSTFCSILFYLLGCVPLIYMTIRELRINFLNLN